MFQLIPWTRVGRQHPAKPKKAKDLATRRRGTGFRQLPVAPYHLLLWRQRRPPHPKHGKKVFNRRSIGFWPVPDEGDAGSAAITLKLFTVSAAGQAGTAGALSATLKLLSVFAEGRIGPDSDPARITLPKLSVSASGTVQAPALVTHSLFYKYNSRSGGPVVTWIKNYQGSRQIQIKRTVPAQTSNQEFDVGIAQATTLALTLYADEDVIVELNAGHTQRIVLPAQEPIIWTSDSGNPFPFTSDVTALFVSNQGLTDADFTVVALILDASN